MNRLSQRISDKQVLRLIGKYLRAGVKFEGKTEATDCGVPQGSPLSPLLANVLLDDLDKYLESQDDRFSRYADDFVICVPNLNVGEQVMAEVEAFLATLKLPINAEKSRVIAVSDLAFLGFVFRGKRIVWSPKALANFKRRIRELTGHSWGVSWKYRYRKLREYITGWMNYYALSEYYRPLPLLDQWIRRRIRMCYLKQWRRPRTRIRHLIRLGVPVRQAISIGLSSKGYYRLAKTFAVQMGLTNK